MPSLRDYFPSLAAMPPAWDLAEKLAHDDNEITKLLNSSTSQLLNQHTRNTTNITASGFIVHTCLFTIVMPSLRDYFPSLAAMPPAWDLAEKLAHDDNESTKLLNSSTSQLLNASTPQPTLNLKL